MTISYQMHFGKIRCVREGIHPSVTLNLKKALEVLITNPMSPSEVYTYNPCPEGSGGLSFSKTQVPELSIMLNKNGYLKTLIGYVWGNDGHGRVVNCPPIPLD